MYWLQPDSGLSKLLAFCDMTSFGGGWVMCYTTDNLVNLKTEVTYDENLPYGANGYRTDCNNIQVNSVSSTTLAEGKTAIRSTHLLASKFDVID